MQPSNEQLEQNAPLRGEKLLEYLPWIEHTLVSQLNRVAALVGSHKFDKRLADGGTTNFFKRT